MISLSLFAGEWLATAALRATGIFAAIALAWRGLPTSRPQLRRGVALAGAAAALAASLPQGMWELTLPQSSVVWLGVSSGGAVENTAPGFSWPATLAAVWLAGMVIAAGRWAVQAWRLWRLVRGAPAFRAEAMTLAEDASDEPAHFHDVRISAALRGPCVAGVWRPVLLVPETARAWNAEEWRMVLAHERQHLRQRDLPAAALLRLACTFYWWHPLAHWLRRQCHLESEALCDRAVLAQGRAARPYVEFLLALSSRTVPPLAAAMARPSRLRQRLERLLAAPAGKEAQRGPSLLAFALVLAALSLAVLRISPDAPPPHHSSFAPQPSAEQGRAALSAEAALRLSADPFPQR